MTNKTLKYVFRPKEDRGIYNFMNDNIVHENMDVPAYTYSKDFANLANYNARNRYGVLFEFFYANTTKENALTMMTIDSRMEYMDK